MRNYTVKSKRIINWLLKGDGMITHGYWVDFRLYFIVKRIGNTYQFTQFKQLESRIVEFEIVSQHVYTDLQKVEERMRKIAPIPKWWEYTLKEWYQRETRFEALLGEYTP